MHACMRLTNSFFPFPLLSWKWHSGRQGLLFLNPFLWCWWDPTLVFHIPACLQSYLSPALVVQTFPTTQATLSSHTIPLPSLPGWWNAPPRQWNPGSPRCFDEVPWLGPSALQICWCCSWQRLGEGSREPAFTSFFSLVKPLLVSHSDVQALAVLSNRGAWSLPLGFCAELRTLERTSPCGWYSLPWMAPFLSHCSVFWLSRVAEKKGWLPEQLNEGVYYWWCTVLRYVASSTPQCSSPVLQWKSACSPS